VGKTTSAVNLAATLAMEHDLKVLLVDMDAQGHCSSSLHKELRGVCGEPLGEILLGKKRDVQEIALPTRVPGMWITPSDKDLSNTETVMSGRIGKELILRSALRLARTHYDVIIVDCPPNLGTLTVNALVAADQVLIPCDMSILALEGVDDIYDTLETLDENLGHELRVLGILRTRVDKRNQRVNARIEAALSTRYARDLLKTSIPVNTRLAQAQAEGTPVSRYDGSCAGSISYGELASELLPKLGY